ncbi:MAG TPA: DUF4282 domain-containing protein [Kiritimatiellia bacterium]|nr:DUF4282 domain-containing protein [Kiritimatiellia bacterium]
MNKGPLTALFDLSFTEFITTKFIKALYVVLMGISAIVALFMIGNGFSRSFGSGLLMLILAPLLFLLYVFFARIWCELIIVLFRIAENTTRLVEQGKPASTPAPTPAPPPAT